MQHHQPWPRSVSLAGIHSVAMAWASSARLLTGAECPQARVLEQSTTSVASSNRSFVILLAWQRMRARQGDHDIPARAGRFRSWVRVLTRAKGLPSESVLSACLL